MLDDYSVRQIQNHLKEEMEKLEMSMAKNTENPYEYGFEQGEHHKCYELLRLTEALNR